MYKTSFRPKMYHFLLIEGISLCRNHRFIISSGCERRPSVHTKSTWKANFVYEWLSTEAGAIIKQGNCVLEMREGKLPWTSKHFQGEDH